MNYLFFFVHPSKFHVFRNTINALKAKGHRVDLIITSKDVLEDLVKLEGWEYTNIFPKGRKMKGVSPIISSGINFFRTLYRLYKYTKGCKYDLFITDDLLVYLGKLKKVPSIVLNDDDLDIAKQYALVLAPATYILSPDITNSGKYDSKKIGFPGYKELGALHPNYFKPDKSIVETFNPDHTQYFILRLVSLRAYHDVGMNGLSDEQVRKLIRLLETKGKVYISAERELIAEFEKYRIQIEPTKIAHVLYYAQMFIGDSQTMTSEAAVLGTPAFRCNDFAGRISVMEEKETKYGLSFNFRPAEFQLMYDKIESLLEVADYKETFREKRKEMLRDKIDLSMFMIWLFGEFPQSIEYMKKSEFSYSKFKLK